MILGCWDEFTFRGRPSGIQKKAKRWWWTWAADLADHLDPSLTTVGFLPTVPMDVRTKVGFKIEEYFSASRKQVSNFKKIFNEQE